MRSSAFNGVFGGFPMACRRQDGFMEVVDQGEKIPTEQIDEGHW